jgi:hypothetical protein
MFATTLAYTLPVAYFQPGPDIETSLVELRAKGIKIVVRGGNAATSNYAITENDRRFLPHFAKLEQIKTDHSLWVEDAPPPSSGALNWANVVIKQLKDLDLPPSRVVASAQGGVAFCFLTGKKYADIECLNDGTILGLLSDGRDRPAAWAIGSDPNSISEASLRIQRFIDSSATG